MAEDEAHRPRTQLPIRQPEGTPRTKTASSLEHHLQGGAFCPELFQVQCRLLRSRFRQTCKSTPQAPLRHQMQNTSKNIPQLTGLRAIAAGGVAVYHASGLMPLSDSVLALCHLGVPFFFVLSGFILSHAHAQVISTNTRRSFWFARFARIWPLTMACFILTFLLIPFSTMLGHSVWPLTIPLNILLLQAWFPMAHSALSFNGVAWTLSVEAFFYLLFPFLRNICLKSSRVLFLIILSVSLAPIGMASLAHVPLNSLDGFLSEDSILTFFPPCRLFEFGIGLISYKVWTRYRNRFQIGNQHVSEFIVVALVAAIAMILTPSFPRSSIGMWFAAMAPAVGFGFLLPIFANGGGALSRIFASRTVVFLGETSFALYLSHQVMLRALSNWGLVSVEAAVSSVCIYALTIYLVSWLMWKFVEVPSRRRLLDFWKSRSVDQ